MTINFVEQ